MRSATLLATLLFLACTQGSGSSSSSTSSSGGPVGALGDACSISQTGACSSVAPGATCQLPFSGSPRGGVCTVTGCMPGHGECAGAGTACVFMANQWACMRTCNAAGADGQCGADNACVPLGSTDAVCMARTLAGCITTVTGGVCISPATCEALGTDGFGFCKARCDLWAGGCAAGQACVPEAGKRGYCTLSRGLSTGAACVGYGECVDGDVCLAESGGSRCEQLCDATHTCPASFYCRAVPAIGGSTCVPGGASSSSGGTSSSQ